MSCGGPEGQCSRFHQDFGSDGRSNNVTPPKGICSEEVLFVTEKNFEVGKFVNLSGEKVLGFENIWGLLIKMC